MKVITDTGDYKNYLFNVVTVYDGITSKTFIFRGGYITLRTIYICLKPEETLDDVLKAYPDYALYSQVQPDKPEDKVGTYYRLTLIKGEFR